MPALCIQREDLPPVLSAHRGNEALVAALEQATAPEQLLSVMGRYIQFNSAFGAGLANLAGEIAARQGLFQDADEPVRVTADRAAEVASDFFYAAVDEFDDRATPWRDTHRTLAQATLKGLGTFFGYSDRQLNDAVRINDATRAAMQQVWDGYGVGARLDEQHNAYYWSRIHTGVEAEHFDAALKGVNNALRFYVGSRPVESVKADILDGFSRFAAVQSGFMTALGEA